MVALLLLRKFGVMLNLNHNNNSLVSAKNIPDAGFEGAQVVRDLLGRNVRVTTKETHFVGQATATYYN